MHLFAYTQRGYEHGRLRILEHRRLLLWFALLFILSRIVLTIAGLVGTELLSPTENIGQERTGYAWLDIWGPWDGNWYLDIAENGYSSKTDRWGFANLPFFPLLPLAMRMGGWVIGSPYIAGLLFTNACLIGACIALYVLVRKDDDESTARKSVLLMLAYPSAFVYSGTFTEAPFLLLVLLCFLSARSSAWMMTGIFGLLAALTRHYGFMIMVPMVWMYALEHGYDRRKYSSDILWLALPALGPIAMMIHNQLSFGDALAFLKIQEVWGRRFTEPISFLIRKMFSSDIRDIFWADWTMLSILPLIIGRRFLKGPYLVYAAYSILLPLSTGSLMGINRFFITIFPLFIVLAKLIKRRSTFMITIILLGTFQLVVMATWAAGWGMVI